MSENAPAVSGKTIFRLASMTKPITSMAALILIDRGLLSLEDHVAKYVPEYADVHVIDPETSEDFGKIKTPITVRHLLSHTSGIGTSNLKTNKMKPDDKKDIDSSNRFHALQGLDFEPGTRPNYSPLAALDVMVKIIEIITGRNYADFLQEEILDPCGMVDTTYILTDEQWSRLIPIHTRNGSGENAEFKYPHPNCIFGDYPCTHTLGGAGLVSTLDDYVSFAKMLLNKGATPSKRLVSEETFKLYSMPQVSEEVMPGSQKWGLGVRVISGEKYPFLPVGAYGWSGAHGSHFWVDPVNELVAVFMKNSNVDGGAGNESAFKFEKAVQDSFCK